MESENIYEDYCFRGEDFPSRRDGENGGWSTEDVMSRVELEISFGLEKLLNLEVLMMEVARRASDIEPLMMDLDSISSESFEKVFEFDVLYGVVDSEVKELEKLVGSVQTNIGNVEKKVAGEESEVGLKDKLRAVTESLKQMKELITDIRRESASFDIVIADPSHVKSGNNEGGVHENGYVPSPTTIQAEAQRNVLHMLEQSIAGELDLEKKLCDSRAVVEELKMKLHHVEHESYFLEESAESISERMFAAENASELFLGASKELVNVTNTMQSHVSASIRREGDLKSKLEQILVSLNASKGTPKKIQEDSEKNAAQEAMHSQTLSTPEFVTLRDEVQKLEEWLMEFRSQLMLAMIPTEGNGEEQKMLQPEISTFWNVISDLRDAIFRAESRTQNTEARCAQLSHSNIQLDGELRVYSLKNQVSEDRVGLLERSFKESKAQLEHANASVDAVVEHQAMLKSTMADMEHVIEDLKEKYVKAETRAESAETKCTLLTDTNLELNEELSFLRSRLEGLENTLRQANQLKISTAKDIGLKTKAITDLVAKLALERERLHLQIVTLTKKNRMLAKKCKENANGSTLSSKRVTVDEGELRPTKVIGEVVPASSSTETKVKTDADILGHEQAEITAPLDDESGTLETVRSIEPTLLNWNYILVAFLVLLAAAAAVLHAQTQSVVPARK